MTDLLTPAQLAEKLEVSEPKVMEWRRTYNWPHVRIGRKIRFTEQHVEQILATHTIAPKKSDFVGPTAIKGQTRRSAAHRRTA